LALYDATGREVEGYRTRASHELRSGADGSSTIDADAVVARVREGIEHLGRSLPGPVAAVGIDTFASSLVPVDGAANAIAPCLTSADTPSGEQVADLARPLDPARLHDIPGARLHSSSLAPRIAWMREEQPEVFARTRHFMALGEYIAHRLVGTPALGTAAAAWG